MGVQMVSPVHHLSFFKALTLVATIFLGSHTAFAENRVALVIGQSAYKNVSPLPNPPNDAKMMADLLKAAGFDVTAAQDLSQNQMRKTIGDFAAKIAGKGPDTVALVFYAGHGLQIDGENFLVPVDVSLEREADVPLQAVRLNDMMNTLMSVPTKSRIVLLDACRNDPFDAVNKTAGRGLALVDTKAGAPGSFISFGTSPGALAEDGSGSNSPYTTALLAAALEPGLPIEVAFKRVRVAVNQATEGRQIPWESSSLTNEFFFFPGKGSPGGKPASGRTTAEWRKQLQGKPAQQAYEMAVTEDSIEAYEAFAALFSDPPFGPRVRAILDRRREMVAWSIAVNTNTAASYRLFLASYPNSDLSATARKLQQRMINRSLAGAQAALGGQPGGGNPGAPNNAGQPAGVQPTNASLSSAPLCPCTTPLPPPPRRAERPPPRRPQRPHDEDVVIRRGPPRDDGSAAAAAAAAGFIGGAILGGALSGGGGRGNYHHH